MPSMCPHKPAGNSHCHFSHSVGPGSRFTDIRGHNAAGKQRNNLNCSAGSRNRNRKSTRIDTPPVHRPPFSFLPSPFSRANNCAQRPMPWYWHWLAGMFHTAYLQANVMRSLWPRLISHQISLLPSKKQIKHAFAYIYGLRGLWLNRENSACALNEFELEANYTGGWYVG